ncbi:MAG: DUF2252 family protein [Polyangiaceae bacterium]
MRHGLLVLLLTGGCAVQPAPANCPSAPTAPSAPAAPAPDAQQQNPLELAQDSPYRTNPALRAKLSASPHKYFRAINPEFATEVCKRFARVRATLPIVNLHGDAHVEQLAITDEGAGLSDFDYSVSGPPVIDLVRFGTSLALAAKQRGWPSEPLVSGFLDAYATDPPPATNQPPSALLRLRSSFQADRGSFLSQAEKLMTTELPPRYASEARAGWQRYVALVLQLDPSRDADFFRVKKRGIPTNFGLGSATTARILYRIEGPTSSPNDDLVLEAKEMRSVPDIPCIEGRGGLPVRIILNATRLGAKADPFLAIVPRDASEDIDDPPWWIQSWWAHYAEIDIQRSLESETELQEVASFAAAQLTLGHTGFLPAPYDRQLRVLLKDMLNEHRELIVDSIHSLTQTTLEAYAKFKQ